MAYTLYEHSQDWALLSANAPGDIADAYAAYVVAEDESGAYGELGAYHPSEWAAWSERNLAECQQCGSEWALRKSGCWECQDCGCSRSLETVAA